MSYNRQEEKKMNKVAKTIKIYQIYEASKDEKNANRIKRIIKAIGWLGTAEERTEIEKFIMQTWTVNEELEHRFSPRSAEEDRKIYKTWKETEVIE